MNSSLFSFILRRLGSIRQVINQSLRQLTKPDNHSLVLNAPLDMTRSKSQLVLENALLRQQLSVLQRQVQHPKLSWRDRACIVFLASKLRSWRQALVIQSDTVLRWHRDLFRRTWTRKTRPRQIAGRPPLPKKVVALIKQMAKENHTWGAERLRGELLKLGIEVSKRTIQKYIAKVRQTSGQTWATFLKNHAGNIWACDFTAATTSPTDEWTAQQLREATPWGQMPKYLIHDRDNKYGQQFSAVAASSGIKELKTPFRAPKANAPKVRAYCERFIGSLKRECLDHMLILHRQQLHRLVAEFIDYYNLSRPHQGIGQHTPARLDQSYHSQSGRVISTPVLGGLHHSYARTTSLN